MRKMHEVLCSPSGLTVERYGFADWQQVRELWAGLTEASPYGSFFLSPDWVEAWIQVFGPALKPEILVFGNSEQRIVGACILVRRRVWLGPFLVHRVYLNTAGEEEGSPQIEFNNLLCLAGSEEDICLSLHWYIQRQKWDELFLNGFRPGLPLDLLRKMFSGVEQLLAMPDYYVDLAGLRQEGKTFESVLGTKRRKHLRQSCRHYGETQVYVAPTVSSARELLDELVVLHTQSWNARNQPGSFGPPVFRAFHETLIDKSFDGRHIQMTRVDSSDRTVGVLYAFVYGEDVYYYQSGFDCNSNKNIQPGYVTLARVIDYCLEQPELRTFHFMAGPPGADQYKMSVSTGKQNLEWVTLRKHNLKNSVIRWLRAAKRSLRRAGIMKPFEAGISPIEAEQKSAVQ